MNSHQCKLCLTKNYKNLIITVKIQLTNRIVYKQSEKKKTKKEVMILK